MKKYFANFNVDNGTRYQKPISDTNFNRIKKDIIEIAKGNIFQTPGNTGFVWVEDENGQEIYRAMICVSSSGSVYTRKMSE